MPRLEDYSFGRIVVDGEEQTRDLIGPPTGSSRTGGGERGTRLRSKTSLRSRTSSPRSSYSVPGRTAGSGPPRAVIEELERRGIDVEVLRTDDAVRRYADLDERRTAAALHLTC